MMINFRFSRTIPGDRYTVYFVLFCGVIICPHIVAIVVKLYNFIKYPGIRKIVITLLRLLTRNHYYTATALAGDVLYL